MNNEIICYPINKTNIKENFESNGIANRTLIGTFVSGGLNYSKGMLGNRDSWTNQLGVSYTDVNGNNIEGSIVILTKQLQKGFPIIVDFTDEKDVSQCKFFYGGHYDDFSGGRHAKFNVTKLIKASADAPGYANNYRMYYYPNIVEPGVAMPTPAGFTKYTVVSQGEVQFFNNSTQVCLVNNGSFPPSPAMNNQSVTAVGIPNGTKILSYTISASQFGGKYSNAIYANLSNTIDTTKNDGYFFIENLPPPPTTTPPPTTPPPVTTPPPTTAPVATTASLATTGSVITPASLNAGTALTNNLPTTVEPTPAPKPNMMLYAGVGGFVVLLLLFFMMSGGGGGRRRRYRDDD